MVTVSEQAAKHMIAMLERSSMLAVELLLVEQGCNGYKYEWKMVATNIGDYVYNLNDDYSLVINKQAMQYLAGTDIILEESRFDRKLSIVNPNVDASCGCGESVNFK